MQSRHRTHPLLVIADASSAEDPIFYRYVSHPYPYLSTACASRQGKVNSPPMECRRDVEFSARGPAQSHKSVRGAERCMRYGTHVAILVAVGMMVVVSFHFAAYGALAIAASFECGLHDYEVMRLKQT